MFSDGRKMHGSRRVIMFCILTTVLPSILIVLPLYLRNIKYADVMYKISDSDVIQIHKGQSSIFCEKHSLKMNTTFNAFQMKGTPVLSEKRKHISLKKSMVLPDDTLEYWGFYLFKGATVELKACSRYEGSKILVVKGDKELNTCGILEGNKSKKDPQLAENQGHVLVTLEMPDKNHTNKNSYKHDNTHQRAEKNLRDDNVADFESLNNTHVMNRHSKINSTFFKQTEYQKQGLNEIENSFYKGKQKRDIKPIHNPNTVLDAGVNHGGNAFNTTNTDASVSSFENNLHECYDGNILINEFFPYSINCNSSNYLEKTTTLKVTHQVSVDGYYYYIFYSDNDIVQNYIHVIFDIYKPTFQYTNMSESKVCINQTKCDFSVDFFSDELVIVEVPTKEGIRSEDNNESILISVCHPRMHIYVFFPVSVLILILLFAFL